VSEQREGALEEMGRALLVAPYFAMVAPPGDDVGRAVDALLQYAETFLQG
jgi:hypothetical protein